MPRRQLLDGLIQTGAGQQAIDRGGQCDQPDQGGGRAHRALTSTGTRQDISSIIATCRANSQGARSSLLSVARSSSSVPRLWLSWQPRRACRCAACTGSLRVAKTCYATSSANGPVAAADAS